MSTFHTTGIVLSVTDSGEQDRRAHLYTRDHGKLDLFSKSSRKLQSKLSPHLEPLSLVDCYIVRGKRDHLAGIERYDRFSGIRQSLVRLAGALWGLELVGLFTKPGHADRRIFTLLYEWCAFCERFPQERIPERFRSALLIVLFGYLGYGPECRHCVRCKAMEGERWLFSVRDGGIICETCPHDPRGVFIIITERERTILFAMIETGRWSAELDAYRGLSEKQAAMICRALVREHGDRELGTERFLYSPVWQSAEITLSSLSS